MNKRTASDVLMNNYYSNLLSKSNFILNLTPSENTQDLDQYIGKPGYERKIRTVTKNSDKNTFKEKKEVSLKNKAKNEQKKIHGKKHKWKVGDHYILKIKPKNGSKPLVWEYELVKFVYTINEYPMNSLIMKRISGPEEKIYSIGHYDCKRLHIKYQPGLEIMSMDTKNLRLKKTKNEIYKTS